MNKRQSNKLNSYLSVKGVLDDNRGIYESVAVLNQTVEGFIEILEEIAKIATRTRMDTTGETSAKNEIKEKLAVMASSLAASGSVFAFETSDIEMEASLDYCYTDLKFARDSKALQVSMAIELILLERRTEIADYLVSDQNLADLHQLIVDYKDSLNRRGAVKSKGVADTKKLIVLFKVADDHLYKKLDRIIVRLKSEYPTFCDAYLDARKIVDL